MYYVSKYGFVIQNSYLKIIKGLLDVYDPPKTRSANWENWIAELDLKTCPECRNEHGKIYAIDEPRREPPLHERCRCKIVLMEAVLAGYATKNGNDGAEVWLKNTGHLPDYYVTKEEAKSFGWKPGKAPQKYIPDKMISGGIYRNDDGHLPDAVGRVWYEADINYYEGMRNGHRILWSNDGLIFITYDHYGTFIEII